MASLFVPMDSRASLVEDMTLADRSKARDLMHCLVADCYGNVTSLRPAREAYNAKSLASKPVNELITMIFYPCVSLDVVEHSL